MTPLSKEKCAVTRRNTTPATDAEIAELHSQIDGWEIAHVVDGIPRLQKRYRFRDFNGAMNFSVELGKASDEEIHHPRLIVEWGWVNVEWWTHKIRALHRNDFVMAAKTDAIYAETEQGSE